HPDERAPSGTRCFGEFVAGLAALAIGKQLRFPALNFAVFRSRQADAPSVPAQKAVTMANLRLVNRCRWRAEDDQERS
ncbi:MAG: hypothetical protein ACKOED_00485, partial [Aestuariivirga sp.]|uniref:hypothetical protein n=1 Tax=Aestuariivirga sp. TaxID=2650926 RepID=UPI0038D125AD